jgi:hypothetical protein
MIPHLYDVFLSLSFVFFWGLVFWLTFLYSHGIYRHCIYDIDVWTVFMVCVYGFVFVGMCLWMCLWICMDLFLVMCMGLYGYRVLILRKARFNKYPGLPLLGARFHHHWDLLLHEAHFSKFLGLTPPRGPFPSNFGSYSSTRPALVTPWVLLLHEAHFSKFLGLTPPRGPFQQILGLTPS